MIAFIIWMVHYFFTKFMLVCDFTIKLEILIESVKYSVHFYFYMIINKYLGGAYFNFHQKSFIIDQIPCRCIVVLILIIVNIYVSQHVTLKPFILEYHFGLTITINFSWRVGFCLFVYFGNLNVYVYYNTRVYGVVVFMIWNFLFHLGNSLNHHDLQSVLEKKRLR